MPVSQIPITHVDAKSRTGAFYLPSKFRSRTIPLMLVFHGKFGTGMGMVNTFVVRPGSVACISDSGSCGSSCRVM